MIAPNENPLAHGWVNVVPTLTRLGKNQHEKSRQIGEATRGGPQANLGNFARGHQARKLGQLCSDTYQGEGHAGILHSGQVDQIEGGHRPLSGAAIGFLRFRSALRTVNAGNSGIRAENSLKSLGAELRQGPVSILDRREFQCAWIVGSGDDGRGTCCGAPVLTGKSWCPDHRAVVFWKGGAA